jgi:hypothetical protein
MPSITGANICRQALREIGKLDPTETGEAELLDDTIEVATNFIDLWRRKHLTISGITRTVYSLVSGTQSYTIGSGGTFNQAWPTAIERWSVIPDDDATDPVEQPRGRPYTWAEWQAIRVKTQDGPYPSVMYWDRRYASGLGNLLFHPIPDNNDVDVVLYDAVPDITSLVLDTTYDLPPGLTQALILTLAVRLGHRHGKTVSADLKTEAREALGAVKAANHIPRETPIRPEFSIGRRHVATNLYTDG